MPPTSPPARRILFLDDDPERAAAFLSQFPGAVWVETAQACLGRLAESWDEVHLDHDLGGEVFVEHEREDCGMAVVRWICDQPRPHLHATRFIVHTRNPNAACVMQLHLETVGHQVQVRPFRRGDWGSGPGSPSLLPAPRRRSLRDRVAGWLDRFRSA